MHSYESDRLREAYDCLLRHRNTGKPIPDRAYEGILCALGEALHLPLGMISDDLERTKPPAEPVS